MDLISNSETPLAQALAKCLFGEPGIPEYCFSFFDYVFERWRPYSAASPFNRPLPPSPQLVANSSQTVDRMVGFGPMQKLLGGTADTGDDWSHPIYFSLPTDPLFTVHCTYSSAWGPCEVEGARVRIPDAARPAGGGDGHLAVIDTTSGEEYDFWQVQSKPQGGGSLVVSYGGENPVWVDAPYLDTPGEDPTSAADGLGSNATAANFGLVAGVIRPEELEAGHIPHALFMVVKCTNGSSVWPAPLTGTGRQCSSIGVSDQGAPAMGQHFFLAMSDAQIGSLNEPAWKKTILRAMAHYGTFVGDTGGGSWGIQFESSSSYTSFGYDDPWVELGKRLDLPSWNEGGKNLYTYDLSDSVDWSSRLGVVKPCVARGTC